MCELFSLGRLLAAMRASLAIWLALSLACAQTVSVVPQAQTVRGRVPSSVHRNVLVSPPRSVVLIVGDDIAKDDLAECSAMGGTPNLDYLAAHGFTFNCACSSPVCSPDRRQMDWGNWWTRSSEVCQSADGTEPPLFQLSVAEAMGAIPSKLAGKWHVGGNATGGPWQLAPESRHFTWIAGLPHYVAGCGGNNYSFWPRVEAGVSDVVLNYQPGWMLARSMQELATPDGLFVFAAQLAHEPWHRPPNSMLPAGWPSTPTNRAKFLAMVSALDYQVGRLFTKLDPTRDVVIFLGDNGTDDDIVPLALKGKAKTTTFERGIRVPLIMGGPGIAVGSSDALVSSVDIYNTVLELFGVPEDLSLDSRSLVPLAQGGSTPVHDYVFSGIEGDPRFPNDVCARSLQYKLRNVNGVESFYDLAADPTESTDLINDVGLQPTIQAHRAWLAAVRP